MVNTSALEHQPLILPAAIVNNASFTSLAVDSAGIGIASATKVKVVFQLGALDIGITALKLQECDTSGGSYTDIPGSDYSAAGNVLPTATDDNKAWMWNVDWQGGRKRYLKIVATMGNGATGGFATAYALLDREGQTPYNAATENAAQLLNC